jgi:hypothetical protein
LFEGFPDGWSLPRGGISADPLLFRGDFLHHQLEQALRDVPGVATVSVDLDHNTAVIEGGGASENLLSAVQAAGYVAEIVPDVQQNPSIV